MVLTKTTGSALADEGKVVKERKADAEVHLRFSCGCGATYENEDEAKKHAAERNHKLDAAGSVVPRKRLKRR